MDKIRGRTEKRLQKIVEMALQRGSIANNDVEKLLRVSDTTASRYLYALVQTGRLKVQGRGKAARYLP